MVLAFRLRSAFLFLFISWRKLELYYKKTNLNVRYQLRKKNYKTVPTPALLCECAYLYVNTAQDKHTI